MVGHYGKPKYILLFALAKCILLSHGNAVPEKGFSLNQKLIEVHGTTLSGEIMEVQRIGIYIDCLKSDSSIFLLRIIIHELKVICERVVFEFFKL